MLHLSFVVPLSLRIEHYIDLHISFFFSLTRCTSRLSLCEYLFCKFHRNTEIIVVQASEERRMKRRSMFPWNSNLRDYASRIKL